MVVTLNQLNISTGGVTNLRTIDSDSFSAEAGFQNQSSFCGQILFDFNQNAYFVKVKLTSSPSDSSEPPAVAAIHLRGGSSLAPAEKRYGMHDNGRYVYSTGGVYAPDPFVSVTDWRARFDNPDVWPDPLSSPDFPWWSSTWRGRRDGFSQRGDRYDLARRPRMGE